MLGLIPKPWLVLGVALALAGAVGGAFLKGVSWGASREAARWQADKIKDQARAAADLQAARDAIAALQAQRDQTIQEAANDIAQIQVVHLPGRVEIQRRTVEVPVYRDCAAEQRVLELVNAARAGRPASAQALRAADGGLPADAAARE